MMMSMSGLSPIVISLFLQDQALFFLDKRNILIDYLLKNCKNSNQNKRVLMSHIGIFLEPSNQLNEGLKAFNTGDESTWDNLSQ